MRSLDEERCAVRREACDALVVVAVDHDRLDLQRHSAKGQYIDLGSFRLKFGGFQRDDDKGLAALPERAPSSKIRVFFQKATNANGCSRSEKQRHSAKARTTPSLLFSLSLSARLSQDQTDLDSTRLERERESERERERERESSIGGAF